MGLYQVDFQTGFSAGPRVLATFLIPGAFFLIAGAKESRPTIAFAVAVILVFSAINFFMGWRSQAAMPMIALAWLWHRHVRPLNKGLLLGGAVVMLFLVFPLVRAARGTSGDERLSADLLVNTLVSMDNPAVASLQEIGGSMMTVAHTMDLVPNSHPYEMGMTYVRAALTVVPNLFWDIHPSVASETPTHWLIWTVDPYTASRGGSLGYSCIAEAYLNFGWIGVPACLCLFGFLFAKFIMWASQAGRPERLALAACVACFVIFYARAEAADFARGVVWYSVLPYLLVIAGLCVRKHGRHRIRNSESTIVGESS